MKLRTLVGGGDKVMLFTLPFLAVGLVINILFPSFFRVGGPPAFLSAISIAFMVPGVIMWLWSVVLILIKVPRKELITTGPFALVKHPIYTGVALLVLPWAGFMLDTWLGVPVGIVMYIGSRIFSPSEEEFLAKAFGPAYEEYCRKVVLTWL